MSTLKASPLSKEDDALCWGCIVAMIVLTGVGLWGFYSWVVTFWEMGRPWPGGYFF